MKPAKRKGATADELIADAITLRHRQSIEVFETIARLERLAALVPDDPLLHAEILAARAEHDRTVDGLVSAIVAFRRLSARRRMGGQQSGNVRRERAATLLHAIEEIKEKNSRLSDEASARLWLEANDPTWHAGPDAERSAKVDALTRRIRRARNRNPVR